MPRRHTTLRSQAREIIFNVLKYMRKEAAEGVHNVNQVQKRTADATGTSVNTVKRILTEAKKSDAFTDFRTPGKKRPRKKPITDIDHFDYGVLKRCIHNFHINNYELPSMNKLLAKLHTEINFQGSAKSLSRITKKQGFQCKKAENNRQLLIEKSKIRYKRIHYLERLNNFRQQGRPIVYTYESYVYASQPPPQANSSGSLLVTKKATFKDQRVFILHAGTETGLVPNSLLMIESKSKVTSKAGASHGDMDIENYEKWLRTQLMPNLAPNSVVVIGNASHNYKQCEVRPTCVAKRSVLEAWLKERNIDFKSNMLKPELYQLIKLHKGDSKMYRVDKLLAEEGHVVLRLPPYHPDFAYPIERIWAAIKGYISRSDVEWKDCNSLMEIIREKVNDMGPKYDWTTIRDKVKEIEESYAKSDHVIDHMTELFPIIGDDSADSGSETSDTEGSSSSSDEDYEYVPDTKRRRNNDLCRLPEPSTSKNETISEEVKLSVVKKEKDSD